MKKERLMMLKDKDDDNPSKVIYRKIEDNDAVY